MFNLFTGYWPFFIEDTSLTIIYFTQTYVCVYIRTCKNFFTIKTLNKAHKRVSGHFQILSNARYVSARACTQNAAEQKIAHTRICESGASLRTENIIYKIRVICNKKTYSNMCMYALFCLKKAFKQVPIRAGKS